MGRRRRWGRQPCCCSTTSGISAIQPQSKTQTQTRKKTTQTQQDDGGFEVVPGSEFSVARTATRANTSDYYVDGKKTSVKDVTSLLKGKGIDLDNNRFLILQGEVEQISLMKPKSEGEGPGKDSAPGLLEYLEDIIGTDSLVPRIEEEGKR